MNETDLELSEGDRVRLRKVVAAIEDQLACLAREGTADDHRSSMRGLVASWAGLVELLALGKAPPTRQCPNCGVPVMQAATRCGYCWAALPPPSSVSRALR
jgi:hypothetical protein